MSGWQTHGTRTVYENPWIRVREDDVTRPDGSTGIYGVTEVRHPAAFVVPVTEDGAVLLVRLFRYTIGRESLEVPAGGSDGQAPLVAAGRELREETGRTASTWTHLGQVYALNGVADARAEVFLAQGLEDVGGGSLEEEGISEVLEVPWAEVLDLVRAGEIHDSETISCLMLAGLALGRIG
ncbi:NUDIX domain-containing protein [Nocardioides lianchengensis]|uniref:8-oxo-dGTP pyrophosphatase MutT, NUDIX family n=1 Tax=Nocardioides lianchengensis TaxID=1045774 RepID=A0A1G6NJN9_9ACTN|nr:NUDIX hydrolase [Nocardioides lianchengensis]NYG10780.1 8-oxo-dGTP pyrophosphatase MutT (NUDIX family) [Nocardioides lianchengensis]SDC67497.1 8-oxo-dGTP pyrophosphatase MutT, NUDIX family [Nocardioides lianchengensis]